MSTTYNARKNDDEVQSLLRCSPEVARAIWIIAESEGLDLASVIRVALALLVEEYNRGNGFYQGKKRITSA